MALLSLLLPGVASADVTAKDLQIAGRVVAFTASPPTGEVKLGIVYAPGTPASAKDEQDLVAALGAGLKIGAITFVPVPITVDKLSGASADIVFMTSGLGADGAKVGDFIKAKKVLCITTELAAVQGGSCTVSVQTDPAVKITANRAVEDATGIGFAAAFKLMISEI